MDIWPKLRYHPVQSLLWQYTGQFAAVVAGRQSGKTEICRRKLILNLALKKKDEPNPIYAYFLPTFKQAKRIAWYPILNKIPKSWIKSVNKTDLRIDTIFGSTLFVCGADKPQRFEGSGLDGCIVDEASDTKPELFTLTLMPMLAPRNGFIYQIGVPKRTGIGRVEFRKNYDRGSRGEDGWASFHWESADIFTEQQIKVAKSQLSPDDFDEQFRAKWLDVGSNVYYNFSNENIRDDIRYNPLYEIIVGCDFNVDPMCWTLSHYIDGKIYTFDEIFLKDTNTPKTLNYLFNKYYTHSAGWRFYGDASSRSRKTSAVTTDYLIVKNDARFGQKKVFFFKKNPNVRDRFASVNAGFRNANNDIRIYVNVNCKHLINDFNSVSFVEGTTELEDYSGTEIGHMSDAFGYMLHRVMPIQLSNVAIPTVYLNAG